MFENLWFWTSWSKKEKFLLWILFVLFACAGCWLIAAYLSGGSFVLDWIEESVSKPIRILYDRFTIGLYEFPIFADNYVLVKSFRSGEIQVNVTAAYIFLAVFFAAIIFMLALATTISRFYFLLAAVFFIVILVTFKLENILLFGWYDKETLFLTLALFLLPAYYMHAFKTDFPFFKRFLILLAVGVSLCVIFYFFAEVEHPFFYIASYGIVSPLILSVVFILMIGFEVVKGFLTIITKNSTGSGRTNFIHFSTLSVIYIVILLFIYLYNENYITWKIFIINAVWLLIGATILGLWGFRDKEQSYAHILGFKPLGAYLYLAWAIICFSTFAYFFTSANDPLIEVLEDAVIYSQLSYSLIFFVYVLANFFPAMMEGFQVHRIIYKPKFMPYFSARLAALIVVLALFLLTNKAAYYQTLGGYYISLANLHFVQKEDVIAREYYELSNIYGRQTHFGNFALAKMAAEKGETNLAETHLARSINRNPTEFAFADLARLYEQRANFFDALFVLKHGVNYFPDSGPLAINFGKLLSRTSILDSAAHYYSEASKHNVSSIPGLTNIYSLYALADLRIENDSLQQIIEETEALSIKNNLLVLAAQKRYSDYTFDHDISFEKGITTDQLIYNFNTLLYHPEKADSAKWKAFRHFYDLANTVLFKEELEYAFALAFAKNYNTTASVRIFNLLNREDAYGYKKYDLLMAQYFMKFGAPLQALAHYENTIRFYGGNVLAEMGLAYMEAGKLEDAKNLWTGILNDTDTIAVDIAREMLDLIMYDNYKEIINKDDYLKYVFLKYRYSELNHDESEGIILSIQNPNLQIMAYTGLLSRFIQEDNLYDGARVANKINANLLEDETQVIEYLKQMTLLAVKAEDKELLEKLLPQLESRQKTLKPYYLLATALVAELTGYYDKAEPIFEELSVMDVFCEECILQSVRYLENNGQDKMRAYNILVDAVEVNRYSVPLNKAYVQKAVEIGLEVYVDDILSKLEGVLLPEDYREFEIFVAETINAKDGKW